MGSIPLSTRKERESRVSNRAEMHEAEDMMQTRKEGDGDTVCARIGISDGPDDGMDAETEWIKGTSETRETGDQPLSPCLHVICSHKHTDHQHLQSMCMDTGIPSSPSSSSPDRQHVSAITTTMTTMRLMGCDAHLIPADQVHSITASDSKLRTRDNASYLQTGSGAGLVARQQLKQRRKRW